MRPAAGADSWAMPPGCARFHFFRCGELRALCADADLGSGSLPFTRGSDPGDRCTRCLTGVHAMYAAMGSGRPEHSTVGGTS